MEVDDKPVEISIVVPVYNEEENLQDVTDAIRHAMEGYCESYEIVFIDDGSTDESFPILKRLAREDSRIRVLHFGINYGQTAALSSGVHEAHGDIIITMDADMQNDPTDIPLLVEKIQQGWDVVSGWRKDRQDPLIMRKIPSQLANRLISGITGLPLNDFGCTLKAYRREITNHIE